MENSGVSVKSYMATLEPDEFNVFFDELTRENQIKDLDGYLSGKTRICRKKAEEKKAETKPVAKKTTAKTAPKPAAKAVAPKAEKPAEKATAKPVPVTRIILLL